MVALLRIFTSTLLVVSASAMDPIAFTSGWVKTLDYFSSFPSKFCSNMRKGGEHVNQILSFIVKPDEMPSDFTGCMSIKKQIKRLRRSVNGFERIESERIQLSAFEEPEVLNRF